MAAGGCDINASYDIKHLLKSDALYKYILDTTVFPREPECMRDLRLLTDKHQRGIMQSTRGGGPTAAIADQDSGRQEHDRGRRVHGLLAPRHRVGVAGGCQGGGHRHQPTSNSACPSSRKPAWRTRWTSARAGRSTASTSSSPPTPWLSTTSPLWTPTSRTTGGTMSS
ncbi:hypothetical protein VPH35_005805 [Triticum aestivum]